MAYRNGTYVAFHANGTNIPSKSDIDYYNLMKAWTAKTDDDFTMNNSHDKASAVRDSSKKATLRASLLERLKTVSYTHLDVYKRQVLAAAVRPAGDRGTDDARLHGLGNQCHPCLLYTSRCV